MLSWSLQREKLQSEDADAATGTCIKNLCETIHLVTGTLPPKNREIFRKRFAHPAAKIQCIVAVCVYIYIYVCVRMYIYIYIYIYVCVCVCVCVSNPT